MPQQLAVADLMDPHTLQHPAVVQRVAVAAVRPTAAEVAADPMVAEVGLVVAAVDPMTAVVDPMAAVVIAS